MSMPNDEDQKKRWRVVDWSPAYGSGASERERYENALNELDAAGYDVYEVHRDEQWIVGRLKEDGEDDEGPITVGDLVQETMASLPMQPPPAPPEEEDEGLREMRAYQVKGKRTGPFVANLRAVMDAANQGDPYTEQRLGYLVQLFFANAGNEEVSKSLADVQFFRDHHRKYSCEEPGCASSRVYE